MKKLRKMKWYIRWPIYVGINILFVEVVILSVLFSILIFSTDGPNAMRAMLFIYDWRAHFAFAGAFGILIGTVMSFPHEPRKAAPPAYRITEDTLQSVGAYCPDCAYLLKSMYCKRCNKHYKITEKMIWE